MNATFLTALPAILHPGLARALRIYKMDLFSPNGDRLARALLVARDHYGKSAVRGTPKSVVQGTYAFIYPSRRARQESVYTGGEEETRVTPVYEDR